MTVDINPTRATFRTWLDASVEGALTTELAPAPLADTHVRAALSFALLDKLIEVLADVPNRDARNVMVVGAVARLQQLQRRKT